MLYKLKWYALLQANCQRTFGTNVMLVPQQIPANLNASAEHKICTISDNTIQTKVVCIAASKMPTHTWL